MPTPVTTPPTGILTSEQTRAIVRTGQEYALGIRPSTTDPGKFENVRILVGSAPIELALAQQLRQGQPPTDQVEPVQYAITGPWNGASTNTTVYVLGLGPGAFASSGWIVENGEPQTVEVNVAAGTYTVSAQLVVNPYPVVVVNNNTPNVGVFTINQAITYSQPSNIQINTTLEDIAPFYFDEGKFIGQGRRIELHRPGSYTFGGGATDLLIENNSVVIDLAGEFFHCAFKAARAVEKTVLAYCDVQDTLDIAANMSVRLRPGTTVPANFFTNYSPNPDGSFTAPSGGILYDERSGTDVMTDPLGLLYSGSGRAIAYVDAATALNDVDGNILRFNYSEAALTKAASAGAGVVYGQGLLLSLLGFPLSVSETLLQDLRLVGDPGDQLVVNGTVKWTSENISPDFAGTLTLADQASLSLYGPNLSTATIALAAGTATIYLYGVTPDLPAVPAGVLVVDKRYKFIGTGGGTAPSAFQKGTLATNATGGAQTIAVPAAVTSIGWVKVRGVNSTTAGVLNDSDYTFTAGTNGGAGGLVINVPTSTLPANSTLEYGYLTGAVQAGGSYTGSRGITVTGTNISTINNMLVFDGSSGNFNVAQGISAPGTAGGFAFVPVQNRPTDFNSGWDTGTNRYTIPVAGSYLVSFDLKPEDSSNTRNYVGNDFFAGPALTNAADNPQGKWAQVSPSTRSGASRTVVQHYNVGDKVGLAHFQVGNFNILCSFTIVLLRAD